MTLQQLSPSQLTDLTRAVRKAVGTTPPEAWTTKQREAVKKALKVAGVRS